MSAQLASVLQMLGGLEHPELFIPIALLLPLAVPSRARHGWWLPLPAVAVAWALAALVRVALAGAPFGGALAPFPSGPVAAVAAFVVVAAYLAQDATRERVARVVVWGSAAAVVATITMGPALVEGRWPPGTLGGAALGIACATVAARWSRRATTAVADALPPGLRFLYWLYERQLTTDVRRRRMPAHVGLILDGHRRYGRQHGFTDPRAVYALGADKLDHVLEWCAELGIQTVTLWVFSTENLSRSSEEVSGILEAVEAKLRALTRDPQIHQRRVRVRAVGKLELLPASTVEAIREADRATSGYDAMTLAIAVAYGGREEIADAVRALLRERVAEGDALEDVIERITQAEIARYLYTADLPDPDLIIRTSGEIRLSGFLLWQSAYSEFYFSDVYWPEFRKIDFLRAVRAFQQRRRRFGL